MKQNMWMDPIEALNYLGSEYVFTQYGISRVVEGRVVATYPIYEMDFKRRVCIQKEVPKNELVIEISGNSGSGKSTLALFIQKCLEKYTSNVTNFDDEYLFMESIYKEHDIGEVLSNMSIAIKTKQLMRNS